MALKSMELTPSEREAEIRESAPDSYMPRYAGGLCLWLDDEALKRLGLTEPLEVGTIVSLMAEARVVGAGKDEHETKEGTHVDRRMSVQITAMELEPAAKKPLSDKLYKD